MESDPLRGLTEAEALSRLAEFGPNEIQRPRGRGFVRIVVETLREPMFLLLLGAAVLYLMIGDLGEGLFLFAGAVAAIGLVVVQEARSERALTALRELAQPYARVIRDGEERQAPTRDLVPGDILLVGEGERLPADGLLVAGDMLSVDESTLTGESAPVPKRLAQPGETFDANGRPSSETAPLLYAGTLVVRGQGVARVSRTGAGTALGRIGASLAGLGEELTPLQKTARRLVGMLGAVALGFCVLVAVAYGVLRHDWIGGALAGVTVSIALVPEEFPMVLAIFLAVGSWRLATHKVLVRRGAVIESLGGATVLCVDKTGTLTENRMEVARLWTEAGDVDVQKSAACSGAAAQLLNIAGLASAVRPVDPMDQAIHRLLERTSTGPAGAESAPERSWPLRPELMAVVQTWRRQDDSRFTAAKGAPEAIFKLSRLPAADVERLMGAVEAFAAQGLRVLGVASSDSVGAAPDHPSAELFRFAGLIGFVDPIREEVPGALQEARAAGIAVVMITGDHPATALAIAKIAGIDTASGVMLGSEVAETPFPTLCERLRHVRVFARIVPEQKLLLVEALKADGEVVVMTGDGINDAPALEAAHIGVAMGRKGTDVAREAADLVLLDDSFASIVGGVRLGRRIFANLRKALIYITAIHIPVAGLALAPILLGLPQLLYPMHVVLLELVIDPVCALVFEGEPSEKDAMRRPPRRRDEALFGSAQLGFALLQGASVLAGVFGLYAWALTQYPETQARAAAFIALVLAQLVLALVDSMSIRGRLFASHRRVYWSIASAAVAALAVVLAIPAIGALFSMAAPDAQLGLVALVVAVVSGGWLNLGLRLLAGARSARAHAMVSSGPL